MDEFGIIRRFFTREPGAAGVVVGIGDDGAVVEPTPGLQQVQVIDTLVEGVHFPSNMPAADVGYRAVAVNLSDIASMGARPRWMTLALTLRDKDESWIEAFANGLFDAAGEYDVALIGGDTTRGDEVVASVHISGEVAADDVLLRSGARAGDMLYVTGTLGDAGAGLSLFEAGIPDEYLVTRFLKPAARIHEGLLLAGRARAAIDLSDGFVADLRKLLDAGGVGAEIDVGKLPLSDALCARFTDEEAMAFALTGGDDYELCFAAQPDDVSGVAGITAVGLVTDGPDLVCRRDGAVVDVDQGGYRHFR
ncbi:MAG: thiamine-phosphate kinase [Woeseiaceae bacterium]|nr:thiamine-phosphate kinase [Woeseiaceae bacterium]